MKKNYDAFTRFCMAMGIDNNNCPICPLQGDCNARPHKNNYEGEAEYMAAHEAWCKAACARAEMAAKAFNIEI